MASGIRRESDAAEPGCGRDSGEEGSPGTARIVGPAGVRGKPGPGRSGRRERRQSTLHLAYPGMSPTDGRLFAEPNGRWSRRPSGGDPDLGPGTRNAEDGRRPKRGRGPEPPSRWHRSSVRTRLRRARRRPPTHLTGTDRPTCSPPPGSDRTVTRADPPAPVPTRSACRERASTGHFRIGRSSRPRPPHRIRPGPVRPQGPVAFGPGARRRQGRRVDIGPEQGRFTAEHQVGRGRGEDVPSVEGRGRSRVDRWLSRPGAR